MLSVGLKGKLNNSGKPLYEANIKEFYNALPIKLLIN